MVVICCFSLIMSLAPPSDQGCSAEMMKCKRGGCVEQRQVCDGSDDCGDGTDEGDCGEKSSELHHSRS